MLCLSNWLIERHIFVLRVEQDWTERRRGGTDPHGTTQCHGPRDDGHGRQHDVSLHHTHCGVSVGGADDRPRVGGGDRRRRVAVCTVFLSARVPVGAALRIRDVGHMHYHSTQPIADVVVFGPQCVFRRWRVHVRRLLSPLFFEAWYFVMQ
jgi:hypothetical protein